MANAPDPDPHDEVREEIHARVQQEWEAEEARRDLERRTVATRLAATAAVQVALARYYPGPGTDYAVRRAATLAVGMVQGGHDPIGTLLGGPTGDPVVDAERTGALRALAPQPFAFQGDSRDDGSYTDTLTWESCVYQAVGAASACWSTLHGAGVFRDDRAVEVAEALLQRSGLPRDTQVST